MSPKQLADPVAPAAGSVTDGVLRLERRSKVAVYAALAAFTVAAWFQVTRYNSSGSSGGMHMGGMHMGAMSSANSMMHVQAQNLFMGMTGWVFLGMWVVMMVAMMFPASAPMVLVFARVQAGRRSQGRPYVPTSLFIGTYLALWAVFGVIVYAAARGVAAWIDHEMFTQAGVARVAGLVVVAAGLYQVSPLKQKCLAKCRTPLDFVLGNWKEGTWGAIRMGSEHALWCIGCCWMLFVILFPLGIMNLALMAGVTVLIFVEKVTPQGAKLSKLIGVATVATGILIAVFPSLLPTALGTT